MNMKSIAKGATFGAVAGLAYCALNSASPMKKYSIKKDTTRTLKSAGRLIDDIKSMIM